MERKPTVLSGFGHPLELRFSIQECLDIDFNSFEGETNTLRQYMTDEVERHLLMNDSQTVDIEIDGEDFVARVVER